MAPPTHHVGFGSEILVRAEVSCLSIGKLKLPLGIWYDPALPLQVALGPGCGKTGLSYLFEGNSNPSTLAFGHRSTGSFIGLLDPQEKQKELSCVVPDLLACLAFALPHSRELANLRKRLYSGVFKSIWVAESPLSEAGLHAAL